MSPLLILARREWRGWLLHPGHYLMAAAFLTASGLGFWMLTVSSAGHGLLTSQLTFGGTVFWLAVTALAALVSTRPLAEERERGTLELLLTSPVRERDIVGAAYSGAFLWMLAACLPAVAAPWLLLLLAPGWTGLDLGAWAAGTLGLVAAVAWLTAAGVLASVVCRRQTTAATLTFLMGLVVLFGGALGEWAGARGLLARAALTLHAAHAGGFADGFLDVRVITVAAVIMGWCLFAAVKWLEWSRSRRLVGGLNVVITLGLAAALGGMLIVLSYRHPARWNWSASRHRPVSERTSQVLAGVAQPVRVTLVGQADDPLVAAAWGILERYPTASRRVNVEWIDPDRHLDQVRDMARTYGVAEPGVAIVQGRDRHRIVVLRRVLVTGDDARAPGRRGAPAGRLDAALASAVYAVAHETVPVVYFLTGHGERSITDFGDYTGYGELAARIRDTQAEVRPLALDPQSVLSNECATLVVAGPTAPFSTWEVARLREFVQRGGRLMLLLGSEADTGLEGLAAEWGVRVAAGRVVDTPNSDVLPQYHVRAAAAGLGEVHASRYAAHAITDGLDAMLSTFYLPRPLEAIAPVGRRGSVTDQADRPQVTLLAMTSESSWVETSAGPGPAQFNEGLDSRGPCAVAACVEKGAISSVRVDIRPTRLVVFGDSQFAANRCLVGANATLFLNALDWLLDQGSLAGTPEITRGQFDLQLGPREHRAAFVLIVGLPPLLALACGAWVALVRRDRRAPRGVGGTEEAR